MTTDYFSISDSIVPVKIIFEDNHLLVAEKPVNIPSQEDESGDPDMLSILKQYLKERYKKQGNVFLGLVHRLDRPAGGVMVFAKTSKAAARLSLMFKDRVAGKVYYAVVNGVVRENHGVYRHYLIKDKETNITEGFTKPVDGAREAVLEYDLIEVSDTLSLVKINLYTGRPHQIRVQFALSGHPLFGDQKYGPKKIIKPGQQLALWSAELSVIHPVKKEMMVFRSDPPDTDPWCRFEFLRQEGRN